MMTRRKIADLSQESVAKLQQEWRAGVLPASAIARKHNVELDDLRKHADAAAWEQGDLRRAIANEALRASVERTVSADDISQGRVQPHLMDQNETVRRYGQIVALVTDQQKHDIKVMRTYAAALMQQLVELVGPHVDRVKVDALAQMIAPDYPDLAKLLTDVPEPGDFMGKLAVINKRADVLLKAVNAQDRLIEMERAAYGLDKPGGGSAGYDELLDQLLEARNGNGSVLL